MTSRSTYPDGIAHFFNALFLVSYALSVLVQYNDPDPWAWIGIYSAATLMCLLHFLQRLPIWLPALLLAVSLGWIALLLPALGDTSLAEIFESVSMKTRAVEEAREIGGLALVSLWSGWLTFTLRRKARDVR